MRNRKQKKKTRHTKEITSIYIDLYTWGFYFYIYLYSIYLSFFSSFFLY